MYKRNVNCRCLEIEPPTTNTRTHTYTHIPHLSYLNQHMKGLGNLTCLWLYNIVFYAFPSFHTKVEFYGRQSYRITVICNILCLCCSAILLHNSTLGPATNLATIFNLNNLWLWEWKRKSTKKKNLRIYINNLIA